MERQHRIQAWLENLFPEQAIRLAPASADASFRRYFRAVLSNGDHYIVMDAPPQYEDCHSFIAIAELFGAAGANTPKVLAQDLVQGFLLLTDLGDVTYLSVLNADNAGPLYNDALDALVSIQRSSRPGVLPDYDRVLLERELRLFPEWYITRHLGVELNAQQAQTLDTVFEAILANNLAQAQVFVHRDYHSRNLMVSEPNPGVLDFQDAVYGPVTYDLASLFKDAYICWDEEIMLDWVIRYWEKARRAGLPVNADFGAFYRDFEWMGVQRHLKVLGIFARLYHRDGKTGYLKDMPLVMAYLRSACARYRELEPLLQLLDTLQGQAPESAGYTF
ncbi:predicted phosphotransferase related to Ser/Thr protein kinases [Sulfuriferula multivorans]|uniref:Predicted phosphotransferase related to Ser/Thr protein kinases n=1 Tax=Sulfuriferula multivorans TaxID=1559896 RepID=A0A401JDU0_9PROT|nr:phosphotransferase [Sulfuriferula multivorans]GBL45832.1 predicted phosphotransferase related to Ser/Thr protein kinases [Sulfuriferula multivorans]